MFARARSPVASLRLPAGRELAGMASHDAPRSMNGLAALAGNLALADAVSSAGRAVDPSLRAPVEAQLGVDLADARTHSGPAAAAAADLAGARAVTVGRDVVLGRAGDERSREVIAHELAHVAQWKVSPAVRSGWSRRGDPLERHATAVARDATTSGPRTAGRQPGGPVAAASRDDAARPPAQPTNDDLITALARFRTSTPGRFVEFGTKNEAAVYSLLSRYGFRGSWVKDEDWLADFDRAIARWAAAGNRARLPAFSVTLPTIEPEPEDNQVYLSALPDGTGYVGTKRQFRAASQQQQAARALRTLKNISGGLGGTIGYALGGDQGSDVGATADAFAGAAAGVRAGRNANANVGAALPSRSVAAVVRRASPQPQPRAPLPPPVARPPAVPAPTAPPAPATIPSPAPAPAQAPVVGSTATAAQAPLAATTPAVSSTPVSAFQSRFPKVDTSPSSTAALTELFTRTSSGGAATAPRAGKYVPVLTRGAAPELKTIVELSSRPDVVRIELVPSSSQGRTPDMIVDVRQPDGSIVRGRIEITTVTGARRGYQDRGGGGNRPTTADDIVAAVRRKAQSTPTRPSQLDVPMANVPAGGTLAVHLPRAGAQGAASADAAMTRLAPQLATSPHVQAVEFYVPGRPPLRYVRGPGGVFTLTPSHQP